MKRDKEAVLDRSVRALRAHVPDNQAISVSADRSAVALGIELGHTAFDGAIQDCEGMRRLFGSYRTGALSPSRKLLVSAHLHDCGACLRVFREGGSSGALNWSLPEVRSAPGPRPLAWGWAAAVSAALLIAGLFVYKAYWQIPPGVRAEVKSIDGSADLIDGSLDRRLAPGAELREGMELRTAGDSHAVLRLADGSLVEVNQRSTLAVGARGHDMTVQLIRGAVIVQAAERGSGHLYVKTPDCRVAVAGTVFSVDAGIKGSRVAVLQGSVHVMRAGTNMMLHPGEQMATDENLAPEPLEQQFTWSPEREKYVGMIAQLANVEHRIAQIPFPPPRYSSDLMARVPADTQLYISIPNLGEFLKEANGVFQDQLNASPELREWWTKGHERNPDQLNEFVEKINDVSQYLGGEVVLIGLSQGDRSSVAMLADVKRSGLQDELQQQFGDATGKLVVLNPASLAAASAESAVNRGGYALVRGHEVVFANSIAALTLLNAQLDSGPSGFADGDFGKQIAAAYGRGAGIILGANLHSILQTKMERAPQGTHKGQAFEATGLQDLQYLVAEHREANGVPANHLDLQFTGTRQRVASWLASPGPIGSLEFVSTNAAVAIATLTKDPAAIADDVMDIASQAKGEKEDWSEIDSKLQVDVRNDLVANLGGDFTLALDGPVLPTPSWKMVIEVNNSAGFESALERMVQAIQSQSHGPKPHVLSIESNVVASVRYYAIRDVTAGTVLAEYTFANGFMILAPNRALVMDALRIDANGNSLARASSFRALLPRDQNENYSSVVYQNLSPVLTPLLSQFRGDAAGAIQKLASDSRPTVICAWGMENRIEAASNSRLFGFDFLTLGAIFNSRNKTASQNVLQ
jgi:FecR protein